jgi:hypothetical protein
VKIKDFYNIIDLHYYLYYFINEAQKMSKKNISDCAIVIPIYKENLSQNEEKSLRQCLKVLGEYPIVFVFPRKLDCEKYRSVCSEYRSLVCYESFDGKFFNGYYGYNALMLYSDFYRKFLNYKYILIYQLDAFIFENNLASWCRQDYDYIGGPVFDLQKERGTSVPKHTDFLNGGFSLRKTDIFYQFAKTKFRLNVLVYLSMSKYFVLLQKKHSLLRLLLYSYAKFWQKIFKLEESEDERWSSTIRKYGNIAPFDTALRFAFDSCPEYAFKLNNNSLPMGCHGWTAYYNRIFWEKFI